VIAASLGLHAAPLAFATTAKVAHASIINGESAPFGSVACTLWDSSSVNRINWSQGVANGEMGKLDTFEKVKEVGIIPAIRTSDQAKAMKAAEAIRAGGIPIIEVSLAPANALDVLDALASTYSQSILIGAGTVIDAEGVRHAALAGARFIVTPGFSAEAVAAAKEFGLAIFAGAMTPTEVQTASASGVDAVKLFPCFATGGARYLTALRGQYTATQFIASGGIGLDNCEEYIRAGACAIGVGGEIAVVDSLEAGRFSILPVRAKRLYQAIRGARGLMQSLSLNVGEGR